MAEQEFYTSKYYTSPEIDQRLLQGLYDDAVKMGYPRSKTEFESQLASVVSSKRSSDNEELKDPYISLITEALRKTPQTLTEAEKTQVRENIDIPSTSDLTHLKLIIDGNTEASKVNFDAYETAVISPVQATTNVSGGKIVYVRNPNTDNLIANGFFYKVDGRYYRDANIGGTDVLIASRAVDRTLYKNKKYICNGITYVADGDFLVKPLSNIINENIGNISERVDSLGDDINAASSDISNLETRIDAEVTRAKAADGAIMDKALDNAGRIAGLETASATKAELTAEAERAKNAEKNIASLVQQNAGKIKILEELLQAMMDVSGNGGDSLK